MERKSLHKIVEHMEPHNKGVLMFTNQPDTLVKELVAFVEHTGDKIEQLNVSRPSLDDIFISIVEDGRIKAANPQSDDEKNAAHEKELERRLKEQLEKGNPLEKLSRVKLANIVSKMEKFANKQFIKEIDKKMIIIEFRAIFI
jgi:hypothetical protein